MQMVPDADLLGAGEFVLGFQGYFTQDTAAQSMFRQTYLGKLGITEWVNIHAGYAEGFTTGFKARLLGETHVFMPSLAVGARNVFSHREACIYGDEFSGDFTSEFYAALGKSIDPLKTRLHLGVQSMPTLEGEEFNPYFAVEKFFGVGLYATVEVFQRRRKYHFSTFATLRSPKNYLEFSVGAVDPLALFMSEAGDFSISLKPRPLDAFVSPGIWVGARFHAKMNFRKAKAFQTLEDRLAEQDRTIRELSGRLDSLHHALKTAPRSQKSSGKQRELSLMEKYELESTSGGGGGAGDRLSATVTEKVMQLKSLYAANPFDPRKVKQLTGEIVSYRNRAIPVLRELIADPGSDRYVKLYSIMLLGEIGNSEASDVLLDVLAQTGDPDVKVEILIALGKMKETRAMYLIEQLANDPNDAVAITAQEVLLKLAEETGAEISPDLDMREIPVVSEDTGKPLPEEAIPVPDGRKN